MKVKLAVQVSDMFEIDEFNPYVEHYLHFFLRNIIFTPIETVILWHYCR